MACRPRALRVAVCSQPGLEGAAVCCRNLQCRSGAGTVLSAFLEGDFAAGMLSLSYLPIYTPPAPRELIDLCPNVVLSKVPRQDWLHCYHTAKPCLANPHPLFGTAPPNRQSNSQLLTEFPREGEPRRAQNLPGSARTFKVL